MESGGRPSTGQVILLATSSAITAILYSIYRQKSKVANSLKEAAQAEGLSGCQHGASLLRLAGNCEEQPVGAERLCTCSLHISAGADKLGLEVCTLELAYKRGAKQVHLDQDLKNILMEAPGKCVPYAVIEGVVQSVKETLNSQFVDNCKGVVQRLTLQEHKMVWNRTTHIWNDCEKIIHQRTNTTPFDLVPHEDGANISVRVVKPLDSAELSLETVYEKFHPSIQSFTDVIGHYISGERPKGIQETEEMLKVGTTLTGVGELVLDNNTIKLQPPKQGMQYYLSSLDFDSLLKKQESSVKLWKILTVVFGFATCATLFFILRKQYRQLREKQRLKQIQDEFRKTQEQLRNDMNTESGETTKNACVICLSNIKSCVFLECGHVCSCDECYQALPDPKKCPICRQEIARVVPLYNS